MHANDPALHPWILDLCWYPTKLSLKRSRSGQINKIPVKTKTLSHVSAFVFYSLNICYIFGAVKILPLKFFFWIQSSHMCFWRFCVLYWPLFPPLNLINRTTLTLKTVSYICWALLLIDVPAVLCRFEVKGTVQPKMVFFSSWDHSKIHLFLPQTTKKY